MTKQYIEKTSTVVVYVAEDGTEFGTEWECDKYERDIELHKIWGAKKVSLINEDNETYLVFYCVATKEELISFIDYLVMTAGVKLSGEEYSHIMRNYTDYINTWITYNYDNELGFYLFSLKEKEEMAREAQAKIEEELSFYALLKEYHI